MTKVLVLGNCQARPLAMLLERFAGFELLDPVILHLAKETDQAANEAAIAEADLILAQRTDDAFPVAHLRSSHLQQTYGDRCLVWPNLFFSGQHPYLRYVTHRTLGRLPSPLAEYHDIRLLRDWFATRRGLAFGAQIAEPGYAETFAAQSLASLRQREADCDVSISDLVAEHHARQPLFFSFNHPRLWLLARLAERILDHAGAPRKIDTEGINEPLGRIQPPGREAIGTRSMQGVEVTLEADDKITMGKIRPYDADGLRQAFYACYDHIGAHMHPDAIRVTPNS